MNMCRKISIPILDTFKLKSNVTQSQTINKLSKKYHVSLKQNEFQHSDGYFILDKCVQILVLLTHTIHISFFLRQFILLSLRIRCLQSNSAIVPEQRNEEVNCLNIYVHSYMYRSLNYS